MPSATSRTDADVVLVEIGGTVGDIESLPFLEAIRQFRQDVGRGNAINVHLTLVPYIKASDELKTKPTQHSVKELRSIGIQPDILLCRTDRSLPDDDQAQDRPLLQRRRRGRHHRQGRPVDLRGAAAFRAPRGSTRSCSTCSRLPHYDRDLSQVGELVNRIKNPHGRGATIAIVGKYVELRRLATRASTRRSTTAGSPTT